MTRAEHLAWAKARALAYVDQGEPAQAVISMASDLTKHAETAHHAKTMPLLLQVALLDIRAGNTDAIRRWIEGFN